MPQLSRPALDRLSHSLDLPETLHTQEALNCLLLSECAYKLSPGESQSPIETARSLAANFPGGLFTIRSIECCRETALHRCLLAEDASTLYLACMGTREWRDFLTDAAFHQGPMTFQAAEQSAQGIAPTAHQGFVTRAQTIRVETLYRHACQRGQALVLCGHSLGAAVAMLCALRLHAQFPHPDGRHGIRCYTFGAPAIGNKALASWVSSAGFREDFHNFILPEDPVPRMLALQARPSLPGLSDASQVEVLLADEVPEDPPAPNHTWRTSLRNALPNALPWRRWQAPSKPLNTIPDQQSNEVLQGDVPLPGSPARDDMQPDSTPEQESLDSPGSAVDAEDAAGSTRARWRVRLPALPNLVPASRLLPAGFLPLPKIPYQSYAHFGWTHELVPGAGLSSGAQQSPLASSPERQGFRMPGLLPARPLLSLWEAVQLRMHRMPAYRERMAALVLAAMGDETPPQPAQPTLPVQSFHLAPSLSFTATFRPPLLHPAMVPPQQADLPPAGDTRGAGAPLLVLGVAGGQQPLVRRTVG
ncbi:hypothetical protein WJX84_001760 [Apatococcus fuscideae]|uniref:Fungal lipase-type domain-containing protein n=1 Tax=Apatococcus fuscideae TaxID=2026836 RepID=A0AAW1TCW0_9CHLO